MHNKFLISMLLLTAVVAQIDASSSPENDYVVHGIVFEDVNCNGQRDPKEPVLADIPISDGQKIVFSDKNGHYELRFRALRPWRVFVIVPDQFKAGKIKSSNLAKKQVETVTNMDGFSFLPKTGNNYRDFPLQRRKVSDKKPLRFIAGSDIHYVVHNKNQLHDDLNELAALGRNFQTTTAFWTGDLTNNGRDRELQDLGKAFADSPMENHLIFGGHDGLDSRPIRSDAFTRLIGPLYYSWNEGGCHFVTLVSEYRFMSREEIERQRQWLEADLSQLKPGSKLIICTHTPERIGKMLAEAVKRHRLNLLGVFRGHYHIHHIYTFKNSPVVASGPLNPWHWGAFTKRIRLVKYSDGKLTSTTRIMNQRHRAVVVYPQGTVHSCREIIVNLYNTTMSVSAAQFTIKQNGNTVLNGKLHPTGNWTWRANLKTTVKLLPGKYEITIVARSGKETWQTQKSFTISPKASAMNLDWCFSSGSRFDFFNTPLVCRDRVFLGLNSGNLGSKHGGILCLALADGKEQWRVLQKQNFAASLAADDQTLFALTVTGVLYSLSQTNGKILWQTVLRGKDRENPPFEWVISQSPLKYHNGVIYASDFKHGSSSIFAVEATTGKVIWQADNVTRGRYLLGMNLSRIAEDIIYFNGDNEYGALTASSGKLLWRRKTPTSGCGMGMAVAGGRLYIPLRNALLVTNLEGAPITRLSMDGETLFAAMPLAYQNKVYFGVGRELAAWSMASDKKVWDYKDKDTYRKQGASRQIIGNMTTPVPVRGNRLVFAGDNGTLVLLGIDKGQELWNFSIGVPFKASPSAAKNRVIIPGFDGNIYCFKLNECYR